MIPLIDLGDPCIPCHTQRSDNENLPYIEAVEKEVVDGGQRDACLTQAHIKQDGGDGIFLDEVDGIFLIVMRLYHRESLRSGSYRQGHTP